MLVGELGRFLRCPELARKFDVLRRLGELPVQVIADATLHLLFELPEHPRRLPFPRQGIKGIIRSRPSFQLSRCHAKPPEKCSFPRAPASVPTTPASSNQPQPATLCYHLLFFRVGPMKDTLGVLLAGGAGEPLYPLTRARAKPAVT